jgi:hypothetical protein
MTETPTIYQRVASVMREIGAIGKNDKVEFGKVKYNYRSIVAVYNRVQPLFAKHGIFSASKVIAHDFIETTPTKAGDAQHLATVNMQYTFFAEDGSSVDVGAVGQAIDTGDKAFNKAAAAAHKYALCQLLCIPYQVEDPDANVPEAFKTLAVTFKQWKGLKGAWWGLFREDLKDATEEEVAERWGGFVGSLADSEDVDPQIYRTWTAATMQACKHELDRLSRERTATAERTAEAEA